MIPYNRGHWRRSLDDRYETLPNERGGRALLGAPGETFRRETFRSAQASLASALGGGSAALGEAPNLAPSARTVHGGQAFSLTLLSGTGRFLHVRSADTCIPHGYRMYPLCILIVS